MWDHHNQSCHARYPVAEIHVGKFVIQGYSSGWVKPQREGFGLLQISLTTGPSAIRAFGLLLPALFKNYEIARPFSSLTRAWLPA